MDYLPGYAALERLRKALGLSQGVRRIVIEASLDQVVTIYVQMLAEQAPLNRAEDIVLEEIKEPFRDCHVVHAKTITVDDKGNVKAT